MSSLHARRPPKLEQGNLLRRIKQRGAGGTLRRPPGNGATGLEIPSGDYGSGGNGPPRKKKCCTPCRCVTFFVIIFLIVLFMQRRAVLDRAAWPLKSSSGVGLRSNQVSDSVNIAKLDANPG